MRDWGFASALCQPELHAHQTDHEGHKRVEFGGVIYTESAERLRASSWTAPEFDSAGIFS